VHILVTGGSGFLGRHVVAEALHRGHAVTLWSRRAAHDTGRAPSTAGRVVVDLADPDGVSAALAQAPPDAVVHAAALMTGSRAELDAVNVDGTRTLARALARLAGPPRLVHVSTFSVEDTPPTPYSESKSEAEVVVRASGLPWVILRPALIYGPDDASNTRRLVEALRAGTMWLPAGGRTSIQPVHVDDVAAACLESAVRAEAVGATLRLGGPEPVSVREFREAVREASGGAARIRGIPLPIFAALAQGAALLGRRDALGVLAFHRSTHGVDSAEAQRVLGYRPRGLAQGLAATFAAAGR
jgi:nucleoside-diphosphate-sugar epimerase